MPERLSWIRSGEELQQLSPQWSALWNEDPQATPFQSPEWLLPWWHSFGGDLRTVCIHQGGELIGILPFYVYCDPHTGERQLLPLGVGTSDYLDGIFSPRCSIDAIREAIALLCSLDDWDTLYVSQLRPGSKLLQALEQSLLAGERRTEGQSCSRIPAAPVSDLPQKLRRNVMYYRNRAQRAGTLEFAVATASNWPQFFAALVRLHGERWRHRGEAGVFADNRVLDWHGEALPRLERAGLLRLIALRLDGEIIAAIYSLVDPPNRAARTHYIYVPAYSTAHADLRPGTVLTAMAIEHAAQEGIRTIDMLRGDEEYKKLWHAERLPTFGFVRYRNALRRVERKSGEVAA